MIERQKWQVLPRQGEKVGWGQQELEQSQGDLHREDNSEANLERQVRCDKLKGRDVNFRS